MKFCHVTLAVRNMEESLRFYRDIIGLPLQRRFPAGPGMEIAFVGGGDTEIELVSSPSGGDIAPAQGISLGFAAQSLEDTAALLRQNGIAVEDISQPQPGIRFFFATDPNGVRVQFVENTP